MITDTAFPTTLPTVGPFQGRQPLPTLRWSAILGGTVAAIGLHILLSTLGVGAGLAAFTPLTDLEPAKNFGVGAALVWTLCSLVALCFGGFLAGRFSHSLHSGFVHGLLVWCLTLVITIGLLSMGTGLVLGGALKILAGGGKAVANGLTEVVKEGVARSSTQVDSFIDEAVQSGPGNATPKNATRAKREIGLALARLFAPGNDANFDSNRIAVIQSLTQYSEMTEAEATKTTDQWIASAKALKTEVDNAKAIAEQKAREAADVAAGHLSAAAIWSFFALAAGLLVACLGGNLGATRALFHAGLETTAV